MSKDNKKVIEAIKIKKSYYLGEEEYSILHGITFTIEKGQFISLMGPSGSGKSTLMNIIGCLDIPTGGKYFLDLEEVSKLDKDKLAEIRNKKIGFVFQSFNLLNRYSSLKNVALPSFYAGEENTERAKKLLVEVGLKDKIENKPSEMSGGQRQRVAIARALINDPEIILADEPTGNLDSKSANEIMELFTYLNKKYNKTIILVTHDKYTASFTNKTIYLKDGLIVDELYSTN
ncbi:macrolide ABC transporter ATP-binding protein [Candidatus Roizmanbacteria bacterium CG_4_10_14_0_2_um_filter_36_9]|uniref:Macrolide ABC transporter ATP-binding protein n=3 Tax=Candidatus Roizmaniibacteriota TaxID=1752723 RepID=A0A2M7U2H0_9BACT|nr:MAG: macrolide ABC transporter ATP-binding protein [Candidatus Roizmanbacteria bacterium CG_4_10_14_0_2_um_filter_36_9]